MKRGEITRGGKNKGKKGRREERVRVTADLYSALSRMITRRSGMVRLNEGSHSFYSARNARIACAVLATAIPSLRQSDRLSVRHTPVLCQNDGT